MIVERRVNFERRVGDRRQQLVSVARERRGRWERRRSFDRRETAAGHVRNGIQILEGILADHPLAPDPDAAVREAIDRLWMGLREIERLAAGRQRLGMLVRRDAESDPEAFPTG